MRKRHYAGVDQPRLFDPPPAAPAFEDFCPPPPPAAAAERAIPGQTTVYDHLPAEPELRPWYERPLPGFSAAGPRMAVAAVTPREQQ